MKCSLSQQTGESVGEGVEGKLRTENFPDRFSIRIQSGVGQLRHNVWYPHIHILFILINTSIVMKNSACVCFAHAQPESSTTLLGRASKSCPMCFPMTHAPPNFTSWRNMSWVLSATQFYFAWTSQGHTTTPWAIRTNTEIRAKKNYNTKYKMKEKI